MRIEVDTKISLLDHATGAFILGSTPEVCTDTRKQFADAEWLGYVVIGASIKSLHFGAFLTLHRKHNNWRLRSHPKTTAQFKSVHNRHGKVCDHEIGRPVRGDLQCSLTI